MAEEQAQVKTEEPTARRREESRQEGNVAFSVELNSAVLLLAGTVTIWLTGDEMGLHLREQMRQFASRDYSASGIADIQVLLVSTLGNGVGLVGLFLGLMVLTGLGVSVAQSGFFVSSEALAPKWRKLSPLEGWQRIISLQGAMRGVMSVLKVGLITLVVFWVLNGRGDQIVALGDGDFAHNVGIAWTIIVRSLLAISASLLIVGLGDYTYQRYRHETELRMTRQELKEELKRDEGDPIVRARRRAIGRELAAQKRMIEDVPRATVVITNPVRLAVALRYKRGEMPAPQVIAKGRGLIAKTIVERARRHSVPVVQRKPIAQALFKAVRIGEEIPVALYYAISEVLVYVYQLRGETHPK